MKTRSMTIYGNNTMTYGNKTTFFGNKTTICGNRYATVWRLIGDFSGNIVAIQIAIYVTASLFLTIVFHSP